MPLSEHEWSTLIAEERLNLDKIATVLTIEKELKGGNHGTPLQVVCDDNRRYALKLLSSVRPRHGYTLAAEQVVGRLGILIGASVTQPSRVAVSASLLTAFPDAGPRIAGLGHASIFLDGRQLVEVRQNQPLSPPNKQGREANAALSVLYGIVGASDKQVLRDTNTLEIFSHDHGLFLPGNENWSATTLANPLPFALDPWFEDPDPDKVRKVQIRMKSISDHDIAGIVASIDETWGVLEGDIVALAQFLATKRDMM
jgi:hypothetical protein